MKLVLGLDGLDYALVKEFDCTALMQRCFGEYTVPINAGKGVPLSPEVWATVLSGQEVGNLEFIIDSPFGSWFGNRLSNMLIRVRRYVPLSFGLGKKVARVHGFPPCTLPFWCDGPDWFTFSLPFRTYDETIFKLDHDWGKGLLDWNGYLDGMLDLFDRRLKDIVDSVPKMRMFSKAFVYLEFPDSFQHALGTHHEQLRIHYTELDDFVDRLLQSLKPDFCLILSDHGFDLEKQTHSNFGFYSCSHSVALKSACDVAKITKEW